MEGMPIHQVAIGSCTNSSWLDMMKVAAILKGKTVADNVEMVIAPGSRQVLSMLADNGALADMLDAGARILECGCGPCIGMGQSPLHRRRVPADLQPELQGPLRHRQRPGVPAQPGNRGHLRH